MDADGNGDVTLKEYVRAQMAQIRSSSYQQVREVLGPMVDELEVKHTPPLPCGLPLRSWLKALPLFCGVRG